jgi:hypothetical protein
MAAHELDMERKACILAFILCLFGSGKAVAQCFASPGNPVAGSTNLGILDPHIFRAIGFYQFSASDRYYEGRYPSDYDPAGAISSAYYNYTGLSIGYGLTRRFSIETELGYFFNKTQEYKYIDHRLTGSGMSNAVISGKYNLYQDLVRRTELTLTAGPKLPFSTRPQVVDGVELPIDVQTSTGNFGAVAQMFFVKEFDAISARFILIGRYENNFTENRQGYRFGDAWITSIFLSKHLANPWTGLTKDLTLILQGRYEYRRQNTRHGQPVTYSGSKLFFVSPQLNYNLNYIWNFSVIFDVPVYQYYNGIQLANRFAVTLTVARDIGFQL